ncbi:uncharacterized protein JCM6883_005626 [Sporobolomyces salmoneus]|uniref:uncharacterized protein n=1 Tax=Sporobolomyces salmoneus TaxID=183962 RepID=UPI003182AB75
MDSQRIRPSLADLANLDLDAPAFPEWELNNTPAVTVSRTRPPTILSTSVPPPVPEIPFDEPQSSDSTLPLPPPSKPKSRFALQREKEAAEKVTQEFGTGKGTERFELDLDGNDEPDGGALPKATPRPSLVKDVLEKPSTRNAPPRPPTAPTLQAGKRPTGFPPIGKGVFPRKFPFTQPSSAPPPRPLQQTSSASFDADKIVDGGSVEGLLQTVSNENENVLQGMSEAQILEEQRQIREEMGLSEGMIKMLQERAQKKQKGGSGSSASSTSTPTPRTRPPPANRPRVPTVTDEEEEEGTPEYIRKHFFPNEPVNPALDWMKPPPARASSSSTEQSSLPSSFTFNLQGAHVAQTSESAPPESGSDHHVSSSSNFTIPSLLSLTASSVPSQRSTAFTTLYRIISHPSNHALLIGEKDWTTLRNQLTEKAAWALRDPNRGVVIASIDLLDYLFATEQAPCRSEPLLQNAEIPKTLLSSFESSDPFPPITLQLSLSGGTLPRSSTLQLLTILDNFARLAQRDSSSSSSLDSLFATPRLLESIVERFIATPWPSMDGSTSLRPSPLALSFLTNLVRSSRSRAKEIYTRKLVEPTLRYLAIPPWELEGGVSSTRELGYEMLERVFELWHSLGRYGIGCELRTLAAGLLEGVVFERVHEVCQLEVEERATGGNKWLEKLLELMSVWTVAAIDPHVTEHDIVWSQVEGWNSIALEVYESASSTEEGKKGLVAKSVELLGCWLEGSKVNKGWRGEKERECIKEELGSDFENGGKGRILVEGSMKRMISGEDDEDDAPLVSAALRLSETYKEDSNPPTPRLLPLDPSLVQSVVHSILSRPTRPSRDSIDLVVSLLPLLDDLSSRITSTILVLPLLDASQAVSARDLISFLLSTLSPISSTLTSTLDKDLEVDSLADLPLLKPFYTHAIVTNSGGKVIGPSHPTPRDLKLTHSLELPSTLSNEGVLPRDWPLSVLDELLRSETSPVFRGGGLPKDWDASELQLVKSSLVLMRVVDGTYRSKLGGRGRVGKAELIYDLMKVFMLEKDANGEGGATTAVSGGERDLFLTPSVEYSISQLLSPLRISSLPTQVLPALESLQTDSPPPLEEVSSRFSTAPFYQLYTDFLGLYDSISLSNPNFALLLLPPLSQRYSIDYRRLLWTDYQHLLRTIKFTAEEIVTDSDSAAEEENSSLARWLYPKEENETILKAYLDGLVKGVIKKEGQPFLTFVAVHHLSEAIFSELEDDEEEGKGLKSRLIKGLLGDKEVMRVVVRYQQTSEPGQPLKGSDQCVEGIEEGELNRRLVMMSELVGDEHFEGIDEIVRNRN